PRRWSKNTWRSSAPGCCDIAQPRTLSFRAQREISRQPAKSSPSSPIRIRGRHKRILLAPPPSLDLLFTGQGGKHVRSLLEVHRSMDVAPGGEARHGLVPVFFESSHQVVRDADVHDAAVPVDQDVDEVPVFTWHEISRCARND